MRLEAEGKLPEAHEIYDAVLTEDETNVVGFLFCDVGRRVWSGFKCASSVLSLEQPRSKRVITIKKVQGDHAGMIATLTGYLDTYYNDTKAWLELCSAYLAQHHYQQTAFCMEELLLLQTANHF